MIIRMAGLWGIQDIIRPVCGLDVIIQSLSATSVEVPIRVRYGKRICLRFTKIWIQWIFCLMQNFRMSLFRKNRRRNHKRSKRGRIRKILKLKKILKQTRKILKKMRQRRSLQIPILRIRTITVKIPMFQTTARIMIRTTIRTTIRTMISHTSQLFFLPSRPATGALLLHMPLIPAARPTFTGISFTTEPRS